MVIASKHNIGETLWYLVVSYPDHMVVSARIEEIHITRAGVNYYLSEGDVIFSSYPNVKKGDRVHKSSVFEADINHPSKLSEWPTFSTKDAAREYARKVKRGQT